MQAITVRDHDAGVDGLSLTDVPYPHAAQNDVIVRVHAAGFTPGELEWSGTWVDRAGRDRTPSVPGHELSGVVVELGYGTTGLSVGQRVFGLCDWTRNGSLAEYSAVEARNLAPLPADIDHTVAAALPISGLTAWQGLIDHARLTTGQTVLVHGAAGGVGSIAVQLAREVGAVVIGTGRVGDRDTALGLGAHAFLDLEADKLEDAGEVDVVFDVIGGEILDRSAALARRRHARHHHQGAHGRVQARARNLLRRRAGSVPTGGTRPTPKGRTTEADRGSATAARRSAHSVRPRTPHSRQDDHPCHRRLSPRRSEQAYRTALRRPRHPPRSTVLESQSRPTVLNPLRIESVTDRGKGGWSTGFEHSPITSRAYLAANHRLPEIRPSSGFRAA